MLLKKRMQPFHQSFSLYMAIANTSDIANVAMCRGLKNMPTSVRHANRTAATNSTDCVTLENPTLFIVVSFRYCARQPSMVVPGILTGRAMIAAVLLKACLNAHSVTSLSWTFAIERTALTGQVNGSAYVLYLTAAILRLSVHFVPAIPSTDCTRYRDRTGWLLYQ